MRSFLLWFGPLLFLCVWLAVASTGLGPTGSFFSREYYDQVFGLYAIALGVDPDSLPPLVWRALGIDGAVVLAIFAFRRRKRIAAFLGSRVQAPSPGETRSLSSAP